MELRAGESASQAKQLTSGTSNCQSTLQQAGCHAHLAFP